MNTLKDFGLSVLASLVASFTFVLTAALAGFWYKTRLGPRSVITLFLEFIAPGGVFFYSNRENLRKALGPVHTYVSTAKKELIYIGVWLDGLLKKHAFSECLVALANRGVTVAVYLLHPDSPLVEMYAARVKRPVGDLRERILASEARLLELRAAVQPEMRDRLAVHFHDRPITAACFLFDREDPVEGKLLVDHSLINADDEVASYGFELRNPRLPMFQQVVQSYSDLLEAAIPTRDPLRVAGIAPLQAILKSGVEPTQPLIAP